MPYLHILILECLKLFYDEMIYLFIYFLAILLAWRVSLNMIHNNPTHCFVTVLWVFAVKVEVLNHTLALIIGKISALQGTPKL